MLLWSNQKQLSTKKILKKDCIYMYCIDTSPKYLFINFLLARSKVKKFILSNIGYNPDNFNYFKKNIYEKLKIL